MTRDTPTPSKDKPETIEAENWAESILPERSTDPPADGRGLSTPAKQPNLSRSMACEYLDELIIIVLCQVGETNGMDIIRELTALFGVQFSPGTVYPHLHSLEEKGMLSRRESVQTKEYRISDEQAAINHLDSTMSQLRFLSSVLDTVLSNSSESLDNANSDGQG
jgi:DNA-binding PadR family transcriptional regulator